MNSKLLFGVLALVLVASAAFAVKPAGPSAHNGLKHGGEANQLYLYEKDPTTWDPIEGGAWGKMSFQGNGDKFVFNGHLLNTGTDYTLVSYWDPWPGTPLHCLGSGTSDEFGEITINDRFDFTTLEDQNKIWLVLSSDVDCAAGRMTGWNGAEYLFEYNTIPEQWPEV